jgi:hypothetical protein
MNLGVQVGSYDTSPVSAQGQAASLPERIQYAKALAEAGLLPRDYRGKPANVLVAMETGAMLGIAPMAAISNINVIDGKPSMSAGLMAALVRRAGHTVRITGDDEKAVAVVYRADDSGFEFRSEWTPERAAQGGLLDKSNWKAYPAAMLKPRAMSEVARDAAPDVFLGPVYCPEELGADGEGDAGSAGAVRAERSAAVELGTSGATDAELAVQPDTEIDQTAAPADAPVSVVSDDEWDARRAELVDAEDVAGLQRLWKQAKAAGADNGVLHRVARDGKDVKAALEARAEAGDAEGDAGDAENVVGKGLCGVGGLPWASAGCWCEASGH